MKRLFLLLWLAIGSSVPAQTIYVAGTNTVTGSGTLASPYKALSSINWTPITTYCQSGVGSNFHIYILPGDKQRLQWNVSGSGSPSNHVTIAPWPGVPGANPIITGADVVNNWVQFTPANGSTWTNVTPPATAAQVYYNNTNLNVGASPSTLYNHEFIFTGGLLYLRWDEGNPDSIGGLVEAAVRIGTLNTASSRSNIDWVNIEYSKCTGPVCRFTGSDWTFQNCFAHQGTVCFYVNNCTNATFKNCVISDAFGNGGLQVDGAGGHFAAYYCLFTNNSSGMFETAGRGGSLVNCTFTESQANHVSDTGASALIGITNCIFASNGSHGAGGTYAVTANATNLVTMDHCLAMMNSKAANGPYRTLNVTEWNTVQGSPNFKGMPHVGYYGLEIDDIPNVAAANNVSKLLDAIGLGWKMCHAASTVQGQGLDAPTVAILQDFFARGHNINCHSSYHSWIPNTTPFSIHYTGSAAACTMDITGSSITFKTNGVQDFTVAFTTNTLTSTVQAAILSHAGYATFTLIQVRDANVPPVFWTPITGQDVKTSTYTHTYLQQAKLDREVVQAKLDLENAVPGLTVTNFVYPNGGWDNILVTNMIAAGFKGGRSAGLPPAAGYQVGYTNNVWYISTLQNTSGYQYQLVYEGDTTDISPVGCNFTNVSIVFENTNINDTLFSGMYNGSNAFCWRVVDTNTAFGNGDWCVSANIWPYAAGSNTRTIYYQGNSATNYLQCAMENSGVLHMTAMSNGVTLFDLSSASSTLTNSGWQSVSFQMALGKCTIRANNRVVAVTTTNVSNTPTYTGTNYWGRSIDWSGPTGANYYFGLMDDSCGFVNGVAYTYALYDEMATEGVMGLLFAHAASSLPLEGWRIVRDAFYDYSAANPGAVQFASQADMNAITLTNGFLMTDGQTIMRTNPFPSSANYRLRATSPLRFSGNMSAVTGVTNLSDMDGQRITDANGTPLRSRLSIGGYEFTQKMGNAFLN